MVGSFRVVEDAANIVAKGVRKLVSGRLLIHREEADGDETPRPRTKAYRHSARHALHGAPDSGPCHVDHTGNQTNHKAGPWVDSVGTGGDRNHPAHCRVANNVDLGASLAPTAQHDSGERTTRRGEEDVNHAQRQCYAVEEIGERGVPRSEADESEENDDRADGNVRVVGGVPGTLPGAKSMRSHECSRAARDKDHAGASVVEVTHTVVDVLNGALGKPRICGPRPMHNNRVHPCRDEGCVEQVRLDARPVAQRRCRNGGGDGGKRELKEERGPYARVDVLQKVARVTNEPLS
mmetsp:Transcript_9527/g.28834  ORF Transcript_9527/g.28834 Transcript_9527/m.28834 type:complete len:293 (+) Transcript_9527:372-1250(+)